MNLDLVNRSCLKPESSCPDHRPLVLAADDDEDNLLLLIHALTLFGFSQISTLEGQMVLTLTKRYQPDLILLDVILPDISGLDVIQILKGDPQTSSIPIIAVTALAKEEDREQLLRMGCHDYLDKPYDLDELEHLLHRYLEPIRKPKTQFLGAQR